MMVYVSVDYILAVSNLFHLVFRETHCSLKIYIISEF